MFTVIELSGGTGFTLADWGDVLVEIGYLTQDLVALGYRVEYTKEIDGAVRIRYEGKNLLDKAFKITEDKACSK